MKKTTNFLEIDQSKVTINPALKKINLDTPEIKSYLNNVNQLLKNVK